MIGNPGRIALMVSSRVTRARNMALVEAGSKIPKKASIWSSSFNMAVVGAIPGLTCLAINRANDRSKARPSTSLRRMPTDSTASRSSSGSRI